VIGDFVF